MRDRLNWEEFISTRRRVLEAGQAEVKEERGAHEEPRQISKTSRRQRRETTRKRAKRRTKSKSAARCSALAD